MALLQRLCESIGRKVPHWLIRGEDGSPYLSRYYLFRRSWLPDRWPFNVLPSVYLHFFHRGDADVELHNHPWGLSVSLILTGGYREERLVGGDVESRVIRPGAFNVVRHDDFHRVDLLTPKAGAWTLFVAGVGGRLPDDDWGFKNPQTGAYLPWREYLANRQQGAS